MSDENNVVLQFLRKNWFGVFGIVFGVLVSYYFYTLSDKEKNLSVFMDGMAVPIINSSLINTEKFSVVDNKGEKIEGDISLLITRIINRGDLPISRNDIRTPLVVKFLEKGTETPIKIIDTLLIDSENIEAIKPLITSLDSGFVFKFESLEPDEEISVVIIFSGLKTPDYFADGGIIGSAKIETGPYLPRGFRKKMSITIFIFLSCLLIIKLIQKNKIKLNEKTKEFTITTLSTLIFIVLVSFLYISFFD